MCGWLALPVCGLLVVVGGCSMPSSEPDFRSEDPAERVWAASLAAKTPDPSAARDLVNLLESPDPVARMIAFTALKGLSGGEGFGYDPTLPDGRRAAGVARWEAWARAGGGGGDEPMEDGDG